LSHVEPLRRTTHVAFLRHGYEVAYLREAHLPSVPGASSNGKARPCRAGPP
jgi:hypothetical protein